MRMRVMGKNQNVMMIPSEYADRTQPRDLTISVNEENQSTLAMIMYKQHTNIPIIYFYQGKGHAFLVSIILSKCYNEKTLLQKHNTKLLFFLEISHTSSPLLISLTIYILLY